jgi:hypothetical protein
MEGSSFLHKKRQLKIFSLPCQALLWNFPEGSEKDISRVLEAQNPF